MKSISAKFLVAVGITVVLFMLTSIAWTVWEHTQHITAGTTQLSHENTSSPEHTHLTNGMLRQVLMAVIKSVILFAVLAVMYRRYVGRRLRHIAEHLEGERGADNQHPRPLPVGSNDEVGRVAHAYNAVIEHLRRLYLTLEARVDERTQQLTDANTALEKEVAARAASQEALEQWEQRYHGLIENIPVGLYRNTPGEQGKFLAANSALAKMLGYDSVEELMAFPVAEQYMFPEDRKRLSQQLLDDGELLSEEVQLRKRDGSTVWTAITAKVVNDDQGQPRYFDGMVEDITSRKQTEEELRRERDFANSLIDTAQTIVLVLDSEGCVIRFNHYFQQLSGYKLEELRGRNWIRTLLPPRERPAIQMALEDMIAGRPVEGYVNSILLKDGTERQIEWYGKAMCDDAGTITGVLAVGYDITERLETEQALRDSREKHRYNAEHDPLTGLLNRQAMMQRLEQACETAGVDDTYEFAVMFLDFDRFKLVNDSMGHVAGDMLLQGLADRLRTAFGEGSPWHHKIAQRVVGRLGGDEFIVLLGGPGSAGCVEQVAEFLHEQLADSHDVEGHHVFATASIGIVTSELGFDDPAHILRDADTAMYRAKHRGRACHTVFDRHMHDEATATLRLESDLRQALQRDEMKLTYQPIISLEEGRCCGFEALLRWHHEKLGRVSPDRFIPMAEETRLILPIGRWILQEACSQLARWRRENPAAADMYVTVNVAKRQLMEKEFVEYVSEALEEHGLTPDALRIEVTESVIMDDVGVVCDGLDRLKELGVLLLMDDFGTGTSSLSHLHEFPIDVVKIDRAFISSMSESRDFAAIVNAIITLAGNLDMKVIAEGVEDEGQLAQLVALDCNMAQGYYFAKPLTPDEAAEYLATTAGGISIS